MSECLYRPNCQKPERQDLRYALAFLLAFYLLGLAFLFSRPAEIAEGLIRIVSSRDNLITDYMAVGGIGAAFCNAALMCLWDLLLLRIWKIRLQAQHIAALMSVLGFSLFGKNILNGLPLALGVLVYSFWRMEDPRRNSPNMMFVGCLGPVVTEIWLLDPRGYGIVLAAFSGFFIGFIFTPLTQSFVHFHQGFSLYNAGFTGGFIAMMVKAIMRTAGHRVEPRELVLSGHTGELFLFMLLLQFGVLILGFAADRQAFTHFRLLLRTTGVNQEDYWESFGAGASLINAAVLGLSGSLYVLLVGGELNGPILGGIFNLMGFAFIGKNIRNALPIFLGAYLASVLHIYNPHATGALLAALFGCTLCPVTGFFGPFAGVSAGFLNMALLAGVGELNSGLNLYNNGFSGGFVAAFLVPVFAATGLGVKLSSVQAVEKTKAELSTQPSDSEEERLDHAVAHGPLAEKAEAWDDVFETIGGQEEESLQETEKAENP